MSGHDIKGLIDMAAIAKGAVKRELSSAINTGHDVSKSVDIIVDGIETMAGIQAAIMLAQAFSRDEKK